MNRSPFPRPLPQWAVHRPFLGANASYKAEDLLKGLCVASANDAAIAFAEKLFGSEEVMVQKMNERAQALGCTNTTFVDAVGLKDETVTTARDLALMAKGVMRVQKRVPLYKCIPR